MKRAKQSVLGAIVLTLTACSGHANLEHISGPETTLDYKQVERYVRNQNDYLNFLSVAAGVDGIPLAGDYAWGRIAQAGVGNIDDLCRKYMNAIFWWNRRSKRTVKQINLLSAASASIMGVYGVGGAELATVAAALGLAGETVDNYASSLLFALEPSGVKTVLEKSQKTYLDTVKYSQIATRPQAINYMQGYLNLCLPSTLETNVNIAVKSAEPKSAKSDTKAKPPKLQFTNADLVPDAEITPFVTFDNDG